MYTYENGEAYASITHNAASSNAGYIHMFSNYDVTSKSIDDSGKYLVVRMKTSNLTWVDLWVGNVKTGATQLGRNSIAKDGWTNVIIDLAQFTAYTCDNTTDASFYIRWGFYNNNFATVKHTIDVAYAAIVDDLAEAKALVGEGEVELYADFTKNPEIIKVEDLKDPEETETPTDPEEGTEPPTDPEEGTECEHECSESRRTEENKTYYDITCTKCNTVINTKDITNAGLFSGAYEIAEYKKTNLTQGAYEYQNGEAYAKVKFEDGSTAKEGIINMLFSSAKSINVDGDPGQYLVVKMKSENLSRIAISVGTSNSAVTDQWTTLTGSINSSEWVTVVIDLDTFFGSGYDSDKDGTPDGKYAEVAEKNTFYMKWTLYRADANTDMELDVAYAAVVDTLADVKTLVGSGNVDLYTASITKPAKTDVGTFE